MSKKHGFNKQAETTKVGAHLVCVSCCGEEICPAPCFKIDCQC